MLIAEALGGVDEFCRGTPGSIMSLQSDAQPSLNRTARRRR